MLVLVDPFGVPCTHYEQYQEAWSVPSVLSRA